jgi:hypothetical protein
VYRVLASHLQLAADTPVSLPIPLIAFPSQIGDWVGNNLEIPNITTEYMEKNFADDFLTRRYINGNTHSWADIYIVYCSSKPGGILGHRPRVCYPGNGWIHDSTEPSQFTSSSGQQISCLIHRFHKPAPTYEQIVVLNFYIFNGKITTNESDFSSPFRRMPNLSRDPTRYVAQVQISSVLENSARCAAKDITDMILDFLPDDNTKLTSKRYANTAIGISQ